ncbi:HAD family hydrolase [Pseudonocardia endophytica]|uniref:Phosphonatase-like hydrolase n=1 Tax=Pseudonocardia endophytica TaxID=401976 RepID=A0A4R1HU44_PSEEN|nr:HAD family hydrolase [Pseudonocardia endophytica]TCK24873.1 phosphonatase-like hydrolase [Pseudonocardia endophytica]
MRAAILDLAGTTMADDGLVLDAVRVGLRAARVRLDGPRYPALDRQARATMDRSTLTVFGELLDGDMYRARRAEGAFARFLADAAAEGRVHEVDGAGEAVDALRDAGLPVVIVTGFPSSLRDVLIEALGWTARVDALFSPTDVGGRGLPDPALLQAALKRCDLAAEHVALAGDATADIEGAVRAGVALTVAVRGGAHSESRLRAAGADAVIDSVADLPSLLGLPS